MDGSYGENGSIDRSVVPHSLISETNRASFSQTPVFLTILPDAGWPRAVAHPRLPVAVGIRIATHPARRSGRGR